MAHGLWPMAHGPWGGVVVGTLVAVLVKMVIDFCFFPVRFAFLPNMGAGVTVTKFKLIILVIQVTRQRGPCVSGNMFQFSLVTVLMSLFKFISITCGNAPSCACTACVIDV